MLVTFFAILMGWQRNKVRAKKAGQIAREQQRTRLITSAQPSWQQSTQNAHIIVILTNALGN
jgi:hypothetical protein